MNRDLVERLRPLLEECMAEIGTNERVVVLVGDYLLTHARHRRH